MRRSRCSSWRRRRASQHPVAVARPVARIGRLVRGGEPVPIATVVGRPRLFWVGDQKGVLLGPQGPLDSHPNASRAGAGGGLQPPRTNRRRLRSPAATHLGVDDGRNAAFTRCPPRRADQTIESGVHIIACNRSSVRKWLAPRPGFPAQARIPPTAQYPAPRGGRRGLPVLTAGSVRGATSRGPTIRSGRGPVSASAACWSCSPSGGTSSAEHQDGPGAPACQSGVRGARTRGGRAGPPVRIAPLNHVAADHR